MYVVVYNCEVTLFVKETSSAPFQRGVGAACEHGQMGV
jgi:hypothetical protein